MWRRGVPGGGSRPHATDQTVGALDLYADGPHVWSSDELEVAQLLANVATGYVIHTQALPDSRSLGSQLQTALDSRVVIEQAKGIVAERHGTDMSAAFELLRQRSRKTSTRLHDIARHVIDGDLEL